MLPTMCNVTDYVTDYNLCHVIWNQYGLEFVSHLPRSVWGQWHDTSGSMNVYKKVTHKHNDMNISSKMNILSISDIFVGLKKKSNYSEIMIHRMINRL